MTITQKRAPPDSLSHKRMVDSSLKKRKKWSKIAKTQRDYET